MDSPSGKTANSPRNTLRGWDDLIRFQLNIAERWLNRADSTKDVFAKSFFYFAGFNALYFLWRILDRLDKTNEEKHIENLVRKFPQERAQGILGEVTASVDYFLERGPIQRMDKRRNYSPGVGEDSEGRKWQSLLENNELTASDRLACLGQILYLVRSNLAHGSKADQGDDFKIIEMSILPLRLLLKEALVWTRQQCPRER